LAGRVVRGLRRRAGHAVGRTAIKLGAPRVRRRALLEAPRLPTRPADPLFEIHTFVTDDRQYREMLDSFSAAGFAPPRATFVRLMDGRNGGTPSDPFSTISRFGVEHSAAYRILCHQDVMLDQGAGFDELRAALANLDEIDPSWVIAGNSGGSLELRIVRRLVDRFGGDTPNPLPIQVASLDENFLVFNRLRSSRCSPSLSGFHFYGSDVCLNAMIDGGTAYVIDFPITHLGLGGISDDYLALRERFIEIWSRRYLFLYLNTSVELLFMSRSRLLRRIFGSPQMLGRVKSAPTRARQPAST
jgi:hypothetical protein